MAEEVRAAGGVLWRRTAGGVEVAVVHRPRYDDWSLPKGKLEPGETALAAAAREVREETGFVPEIGRALGESRYHVGGERGRRPKSVLWWAMRVTDGEFAANGEVDELRWVLPDDGAALLTAGHDAEPIRRLAAAPVDTRTVLLLRHGSAGDKRFWQGDDDARPLDLTGREQAEAAAAALPVFGVRRLVSAPLERCRATLRPLACRTGIAVEEEEAVGAASFGRHPDRTYERLAAYAADGRTTVVCSQRQVIPDVVRTLAAGAGLPGGEVVAPKGSVWVLSVDYDGRVVAADRAPDLPPP